MEQITIDSPQGPALERCIFYLENDTEYSAKNTKLLHGINTLNANLDQKNQITFCTEYILEQDWNKNWKKFFKPFNLTKRLVIKPTWEEYSSKNDETVIEMDPGLAFGTGKHASTKLALQLIDQLFENEKSPEKILDVGTGTGILGMSCALYGASHVIGIDNDIDARIAAQDNIKNNKLSSRMQIDDRNLEQIPGTFDLIIANITVDVLKVLATEINQRLGHKGKLVLSGILTGPQADEVKQTYLSLGFTQTYSTAQGEWTAFSFIKT